MFKAIKISVVMGVVMLLTPAALAKIPDEVLVPYRAYRAALDKDDALAAKESALKAWEAAEKHLGDHKTTGDLAINYANIDPTGKEKNPYKNYEARAKAYKRGIKLSSFYGDDIGVIEVERRIALADLELTVTRYRSSRIGSRKPSQLRAGKLSSIQPIENAIAAHNLIDSTFDGDLQVLYARYYQLNNNPKKAIEYGEKAIDIYKNRTDGYSTKYAYFIHIFKGNSHYDLANKTDDVEEKIKAALEYQVVMQNLEGNIPSDHPFVQTAFTSWMKTRSDIEDSGLLEKAEQAGLCECWPFEDYKNKAVPLKRVPPRMPSSARSSGHVYVKFDVNDAGQPVNISVVSSSRKLFEKSAVKSVENWKYSKLQPDTDPENRKDISAKITYRLTNSTGNIVPE